MKIKKFVHSYEMRSFFTNTTSILLALLVFVSTLSFTVDQHFCGNKLVASAILKKAKTCGMEMEASAPLEGCSILKDNCCSNKQLLLKGQDELKNTLLISLSEKSFATLDFTIFKLSVNVFTEENPSNRFYQTPLIVRSIYQLDEVYLI